MVKRKILIAIIAGVAVFGAACTSDAAELTTTSSTPVEIPDLEFGSGDVPFTVPAGFPVPDSAVVGSTMIDGQNGRTEMNINFPAKVEEVVAFYETNLPVRGFVVVVSKGTETEWEISHEKDGAEGVIRLIHKGSGLSTGTFSFDHS
jgi:hypothetical protein